MKKVQLLVSVFIVFFVSEMAMASTFGSYGHQGMQGTSGRDGDSGDAMTVVADGKVFSLDQRGTDGERGYQGQMGGDAMGCVQPMNTPYNLEGADGGEGGDGGRGGDGGHGGNLLVYYNDLANLKNIYVNGTPGRGASGGYGSNGGRPCYCTQASWTVTNGTTTQTYHCSNGQYGRQGNNGSTGSSGSYGSIKLIGQLTPLTPTQSSITTSMSNMDKGPFELSADIFESKKGARLLFAPHSSISDNYTLWTGRRQQFYSFNWQSPRPLSDFAQYNFTLQLSNSGVNLYLSNNLWVDGAAEQVDPTHTVYTVKNVVKSSEVSNFKFKAGSGSGTGLIAEITDNANVSEMLNTTVSIEYYTRSGNYYYRRFDGAVAPENVTITAGSVAVAIGKLTMDPKYLAPGVKTFMRIYLKRSLGKHYGTWYTEGYYTIP